MDLEAACIIIGTGGAVVSVMYLILDNIKADINTHIDKLYAQTAVQGQRIDHLYQMFIDLLKDKK